MNAAIVMQSLQDNTQQTPKMQSVQHPIPAPPDQRTVQAQPGWPGPSEGGPRPCAVPPSAASSGQPADALCAALQLPGLAGLPSAFGSLPFPSSALPVTDLHTAVAGLDIAIRGVLSHRCSWSGYCNTWVGLIHIRWQVLLKLKYMHSANCPELSAVIQVGCHFRHCSQLQLSFTTHSKLHNCHAQHTQHVTALT